MAYSVMCSGKNRNIEVALTWLNIIQSAELKVDAINHELYYQDIHFNPMIDFGVVEMELRGKKCIVCS